MVTITSPRQVVIVGGGFAGLLCARGLAKAPVEVTLIDKQNHHLFQPLLYQVASAALSPAEIAAPIRSVVRGQKNTRVLLDEIVGIDLEGKKVRGRTGNVAYDYLVLAAGAENNFFGHNEWAQHAVGLKDLDDAVEIRRRILVAFEAAEREGDEAKRKALLTFVVIGGGATGVEMAGALQELSTHILARDFRKVNAAERRVILLEGGPRLLAAFPEGLGKKAEAVLFHLGVHVRTGCSVNNIDASGVAYSRGKNEETLATSTVMWTAGVKASGLAAMLGVPTVKGGRAPVGNDCTIAGHPEVFVLGDMASFVGPHGDLPGVAPVAMQQGRYAARAIKARVSAKSPPPFRYIDKGSLATIGRSQAVAAIGKLELSGFFAWVAWLLVHIFYLIGFRNRVAVMLEWAWAYATFQRGARLITGHRLFAGAPSDAPASDAGETPPKDDEVSKTVAVRRAEE